MQQRSLIRARDLASFRAALVERARAGHPLDARRRAIIVPSRAAAELLRQTIESAAHATTGAADTAVILPDLLTRDEWLAALHSALPNAGAWLSRIDREVLLARAARRAEARRRMPGRPFRMRPGLVAGMLDFYDELQRRQRTVPKFARSLFDQLRHERGTDRGSEELIHQTSFLGFTFLAYERGVVESGGMDEHRLRAVLLDRQPTLPIDHVVVAVADHPSDPRGLWPADFDLLGRLRGVSRIDVVVTDETHDAGFRERMEQEFPGIAETRRRAGDAEVRTPPVLQRPAAEPLALCVVSRDREEELRDVVRRIRARAALTGDVLREPVVVAFARRLPYLYLAQRVFDEAGVPCQTFDALPLAAEPWAALLDVTMAFARTGGTRETAVSLLRSRLLRFEVAGIPVGLRDAAALDAVLSARRATGEADGYAAEVDGWFGERHSRDRIDRLRAMRAAGAADAARTVLLPFRDGASASVQVGALIDFLRRASWNSSNWPNSPNSPDSSNSSNSSNSRGRLSRARAGVLGVLDSLAGACRRFDDQPRDPDDLIAAIHHAIEARTFSPRRGQAGVHLADAVAARFGAFDHAHLVGLVETEWPERAHRSVFYTTGLLKSLGWPQAGDETRAHMAAFRDLLGLARRTTTLHAFQLEDDAVVAVSPMVDAARGVPIVDETGVPTTPIFADEVLVAGGLPAGANRDDLQAWLSLRQQRPSIEDLRYSGQIDPALLTPAPYRVTRVDRYVACPFKYFSESVLQLPEEREEMSGLTPLERGTLVHHLFEEFYKRWQADGLGTISAANLPQALDRFGALVRDALAPLPAADRVLEETRLLGSIVARGLAERVFELEADAGGTVVDRLIEFDLKATFTFPALGGLKPVPIAIRGKADRIDVFADRSLRVVDYKLSRQPDPSSIQIGVYAHCVQQALAARDGRDYRVGAAMYLAFGDDRNIEGPLGSRSEPVEFAVAAKASAFAGHVEAIEAGSFPPRPRRAGECDYCRYSGVCRKEYRLDAGADPGVARDEKEEEA